MLVIRRLETLGEKAAGLRRLRPALQDSLVFLCVEFKGAYVALEPRDWAKRLNAIQKNGVPQGGLNKNASKMLALSTGHKIAPDR